MQRAAASSTVIIDTRDDLFAIVPIKNLACRSTNQRADQLVEQPRLVLVIKLRNRAVVHRTRLEASRRAQWSYLMAER